MGAAGKGLPDRDCYFSVLRDAFASDRLDPAGLYFGTRGGQLFASRDEGESWNSIADWLPAVLCVKAVEVASVSAMIFICHLRSDDLPVTKRSSK